MRIRRCASFEDGEVNDAFVHRHMRAEADRIAVRTGEPCSSRAGDNRTDLGPLTDPGLTLGGHAS
jgi:hypothetical protein